MKNVKLKAISEMLTHALMSGAGYCGVADSEFKTMLNSEDEDGNEFSITIRDITGERKAKEKADFIAEETAKEEAVRN